MITTRENDLTEELIRISRKIINGIEVYYEEVYYLDYLVNENTGMIDKSKKVPHYTKEQATRNIEALKSAYLIAKAKL